MPQIGGHANAQLKQLIREGALNPLGPEDVRDTVDSSIAIADDKNNLQVMQSRRNRWTDENVSKIADSLDAYLQRYNIQIDARKQPLFREHVQKYAAFKTAIFSSLPPSDDLARIVAGQIARGIRWANRPDVEYPNETQRRKAKDQIRQVLSELADTLQTLKEQRYPNGTGIPPASGGREKGDGDKAAR